jgi:hypothetical protein
LPAKSPGHVHLISLGCQRCFRLVDYQSDFDVLQTSKTLA